MFDSSFIRNVMIHLACAARYRADSSEYAAKADECATPWRAGEYRKSAERAKVNARNCLAWARRQNATARLYTEGDDLLRAADALDAAGQPIIAQGLRMKAAFTFDRADSFPWPDLL